MLEKSFSLCTHYVIFAMLKLSKSVEPSWLLASTLLKCHCDKCR